MGRLPLRLLNPDPPVLLSGGSISRVCVSDRDVGVLDRPVGSRCFHPGPWSCAGVGAMAGERVAVAHSVCQPWDHGQFSGRCRRVDGRSMRSGPGVDDPVTQGRPPDLSQRRRRYGTALVARSAGPHRRQRRRQRASRLEATRRCRLLDAAISRGPERRRIADRTIVGSSARGVSPSRWSGRRRPGGRCRPPRR